MTDWKHDIENLSRINEIGDIIKIETEIDITKTDTVNNKFTDPFVDSNNKKITNKEKFNISRSQQRNYETLVQVISLRGNPIYISNPTKNKNSWSVVFATEQVGIYDSNSNNELDLLHHDFENVPVITGLSEKNIKSRTWNKTNIHLRKINRNYSKK